MSRDRSWTSSTRMWEGGCGAEARSGSDMRRLRSTPTVQKRILVRALVLDSSRTEYPTCTSHRRLGTLHGQRLLCAGTRRGSGSPGWQQVTRLAAGYQSGRIERTGPCHPCPCPACTAAWEVQAVPFGQLAPLAPAPLAVPSPPLQLAGVECTRWCKQPPSHSPQRLPECTAAPACSSRSPAPVQRAQTHRQLMPARAQHGVASGHAGLWCWWEPVSSHVLVTLPVPPVHLLIVMTVLRHKNTDMLVALPMWLLLTGPPLPASPDSCGGSSPLPPHDCIQSWLGYLQVK